MINRTIQPEIRNIESVNIPKTQNINLPNGIPLHIINGGIHNVAKIDLIIKAGSIHSSHKLEAPLTSLMLNEGTAKLTAKQIAETFDFYGAHFTPKAEKDYSFAGMVSLNKHLERTLPVFTEIISESVITSYSIHYTKLYELLRLPW